jgi:hypothetical protein
VSRGGVPAVDQRLSAWAMARVSAAHSPSGCVESGSGSSRLCGTRGAGTCGQHLPLAARNGLKATCHGCGVESGARLPTRSAR